MAAVVLHLNRAAALGLGDRLSHRLRLGIGVHQHGAVHVARGAADDLDQRRRRAQKADLVGVQDGDQRHLGQVEPFAQQVDADQDVVLAGPQVAQELHALDGLDLGMEVPHAQSDLGQIGRQVLRHALGEGGDQTALAGFDPGADLTIQVVDLAFARPDVDLRIEQTGGADDLLGHAVGQRQLLRPRGGGDEQHAADQSLELVIGQGAVIERRRQPEAVLHQRLLARAVALEHAAELRQGDVRLVDDRQKALRQEVDQDPRTLARLTAAQVPRVVLDAGTVAHLLQHLQVILGAGLQALRLHHAVGGAQLGQPILELLTDGGGGGADALLRGDEVLGRIDGAVVQIGQSGAVQRIDAADPLHLIAEELDADRLLRVGGEYLQHVAAHAEGGAVEHGVVALVLHRHQTAQQRSQVEGVAEPHLQAHLTKVARTAQAVDARHGRHHDRIAPLDQRGGRRQAHALDLVVDRGVLLYVEVARGDVRLRLVVVVVGDEVLHRVVGKEVLELAKELRGQRLVVRQHQRGPLAGLHDLGHGEGLARSGDPLQGVKPPVAGQPRDDRFGGVPLIAGRLERRVDGEPIHRGRSLSVTDRSRRRSPRSTTTNTSSPGLLSSSAAIRSWNWSIRWPSISTTMSPPA